MSEPEISPYAAGWQCRCPKCGKGRLFKATFALDLEARCDACGLDFGFIDTGDGPAVFVIMILGFLILGAALLVEFTVHPPFWLHVVLWVPATLYLALGMLRPLKALLIALQYRHKIKQRYS